MVKRAKTPEANEEAKYYTCWSPYPNNPDFELSEHYIQFSRWIANILEDSNALHSLYYKPKHGMVIFAVDKSYRRTERLLGEHRWSEFLKKPKNGEQTLVSKIFYSTFSTDREVQKDGWKCIFVEEYFFLNWGIDKWFTKVPYPAPHWCDVPSENRVHKALCRPLPGAQVPRPGPSVPPPRQVPGSADWAQTKASAATNSQRATPRGRGTAVSTGRGAKTNKQANAKPAWGQDSFPSLDSKAPAAAKKIIPGLSSPTAPPVQSAWGNRPSESALAPSPPHRSALAPPENSTAHQVWGKNKSSTTPPPDSPSGSENTPPAKPQNAKGKHAPKPSPVATTANAKKGKNATTSSSHPGKLKYSSSGSSSSQSEGSNTASPPSSAPSSPSLSSAISLASESVSGSVQIDPSEYDNDYDYDEELTEETYHENWETASVYAPNENDAIAVHIGKGKSVSQVTTSKTKMATDNLWPEDNPQPSSSSTPVNLWAKPEPVKQEPVINLWANSTPNLRPTGRASAVEARAEIGEEILCPHHKGKCPRGVCKAYKEEKKRVEKLQRQQEKQKQKAEEEKEEKRKAKEEGGSGEKKETREETKKVDQESPVEKKGPKKESKKKPKKKAEEEKESKKESKKKAEEEPKKKVEEETPMEDMVVTPTPSPPPSNDQSNKKMWADYEIDEDSDFGDLPDFGGKKRFYADEDFETHED